MDDDNRIDSFDDLFEPFQLDEEAPASVEAPPAYEERMVACPSCGTRNPADNRHCESCGARIAQGPLPVAPPPMLRTTPGARALGVLAAVILVVALAALLFDFFRGSDDETPSTDSTVTASSTTVATLPPVEVAQLFPFTVEASSELPGWEATHLIDTDATNSWNDASLSGEGAELTFRFDQPVQISQIVIHNLTDEERFRRNFRIKGLEISINDLPTKALETLDDTMEPQAIQIASVQTSEVVLRVTSTYEAQAFDGKQPFTELALQEVKFYGRASPTATNGG